MAYIRKETKLPLEADLMMVSTGDNRMYVHVAPLSEQTLFLPAYAQPLYRRPVRSVDYSTCLRTSSPWTSSLSTRSSPATYEHATLVPDDRNNLDYTGLRLSYPKTDISWRNEHASTSICVRQWIGVSLVPGNTLTARRTVLLALQMRYCPHRIFSTFLMDKQASRQCREALVNRLCNSYSYDENHGEAKSCLAYMIHDQESQDLATCWIVTTKAYESDDKTA